MNSGGAALAYDSFGRRVAKSIAGNAKGFLYDGANIVQELQGTTPTANLLTGGVDEVFLRTDSGGTANLADALGSTLALADGSGTIQTQYAYEPFGKTTVAGAASGNVNAYTGRELDETGLYFYRARYYEPQIGRFLSEDPIQLRGGPNLYVYVRNSPVLFIDPEGLDPRDPYIQGVIGLFPGAQLNPDYTITLPDTYAWADVVQTLTANGYYSGLLAYDPIYHSGGEEFRLPGPNPGFHFKLRYPTHGACNPKREKLTVEDIHLDPHNPVGNGIENTVEHILFDFLNLDKTPMGSEWVTP